IAKLIDDERARAEEATKDWMLKQTSRRGVFMLLFFVATVLLYAEGAGDIRLKPLAETHTEIFVDLALAVQKHWQAQESTNTTPPGNRNSPRESTREQKD